MLRNIVTGALLAGSALAAPAIEARQSQNIDPTILQFALTLEHLENAFYKGALAKFSVADFAAAGYDATYYNNLRYISYDEATHVQFLSTALTAAKQTPVQPCNYNFPYTDVKSFITLSSVLEGVGTSAYLGAAPLVTDKGYLTAAGSILVVEALHTSYQRAAIKEVPMANPFGTPIDPMSAYTLAAMFITTCPPNNTPLPFTAFPTLTYAGPSMKRDIEARQASGYSNVANFPGSGACYPTNYYAAQDQGQLNSNTGGSFASQVRSRCESSCSANSACQAFVGIYQVAADSPNLATSTCFFYNTASLTPRGCADHPYSMIAEQKGGSSSSPTTTPSATTPAATTPTGTSPAGTSPASSPAASPISNGNGPAPSLPVNGQIVKFTTAGSIPAGSFVTFVSGLSVVSVPGTISGNSVTAAIPSQALGQTYVFLTSKDEAGALKDTDVLAGPAIIEVAPPAV